MYFPKLVLKPKSLKSLSRYRYFVITKPAKSHFLETGKKMKRRNLNWKCIFLFAKLTQFKLLIKVCERVWIEKLIKICRFKEKFKEDKSFIDFGSKTRFEKYIRFYFEVYNTKTWFENILVVGRRWKNLVLAVSLKNGLQCKLLNGQ